MNAEGLIQFEEGRKSVGYLDTRGIPTIGIGHTGKEVYVGLVWTDQQIDGAFLRDYDTALNGITAALPWVSGLDEVRKAVLVSMAFQMGVHGVLGFPRALAAMRDQRWNDAAGELRASDWHAQTPARCERAARAVETGAWQIT